MAFFCQWINTKFPEFTLYIQRNVTLGDPFQSEPFFTVSKDHALKGHCIQIEVRVAHLLRNTDVERRNFHKSEQVEKKQDCDRVKYSIISFFTLHFILCPGRTKTVITAAAVSNRRLRPIL